MKALILIQLIILLAANFVPVNGQSPIEAYYYLLYKYEGIQKGQKFSHSVYLTDDINGDGYGDILIGAHAEDIGFLQSVGRAYVYSGFDGELLYTYSGENESAYLGIALADIEDTNGDGLSEVLIGAKGTNLLTQGSVGKVYHYSGVDGQLIREYWGETWGDRFGNDLEGIGDVDGDGWGDFVVGAHLYDDGVPYKRGAVYVFSGHKGDMLHKFEGIATPEELGYMVCKTGPIDLDPAPDFAYLTLNNKTGNPPEGGRVTIRSGINGSHIKDILGDLPEFKLYRLEYGGDINGDHRPDILIGQMNYQNGSLTSAGRVFVYSGEDWSVLYTIIGQNKDGNLGVSISTAGDLNNDGCCDFLIGASGKNDLGITGGGAVYIHSGIDGSILATAYGNENSGRFGIAVHGGGDVNADGLPDIIIGTDEDCNGVEDSGSAYVYAAKSLKATDEVPLGGTLKLDIRVPAQPYGLYYLGFSLGSQPGIPVGTRTFPLNWDYLFSITFGNPLFIGYLDGEGEEQIAVPIPNDPALSGLTFYGAFLSIKAGAPKGVGTISNPEKITLK